MPLWNKVEYASIDKDDPRSLDHIRNPYFNHFNMENEQDLLNSIIAESIQFSGVEFYYIKRETPNIDQIFGEDPSNHFEKFWKVVMYIETFDGWQGQSDFYSKFGMTVADEATFIIQPNLFKHQLGNHLENPRPGDLLLWNRGSGPTKYTLFEIVWVEPDNPFHPNGTLPMRRLNVQKFAYSNERMDLVNNSNIPDNTDLPDDILDELIILDERLDVNIQPFAESKQIQDEADEIVVFDEDDPFGSIY